jgi:hypothetical protein
MTMQVANTILSQLGGNRFLAMTGARDLMGSENSLTMRLPRGAKSGITHIRVTLDPSDTYTVKAMKFNKRALQMTDIATQDDVYADNLRDIFEAMTGLYTRL